MSIISTAPSSVKHGQKHGSHGLEAALPQPPQWGALLRPAPSPDPGRCSPQATHPSKMLPSMGISGLCLAPVALTCPVHRHLDLGGGLVTGRHKSRWGEICDICSPRKLFAPSAEGREMYSQSFALGLRGSFACVCLAF